MLPCLSPSTLISMWRGSTMNFSMKTRSSPNEDLASALARPKPSATSEVECAIRIPLPPPPAEAFIITGSPISSAILTAWFSSSMTPRWAGRGGDVGFGGGFLRLDLVAHRGDGARIGTDEDDTGGRQRARKSFALGQESVARMHRLGTALAAGLDDFLHHQIALGRGRRPDQHRIIGHFDVQRVAVGLGIDGDSLDPHAAGSLDDPAGDLA